MWNKVCLNFISVKENEHMKEKNEMFEYSCETLRKALDLREKVCFRIPSFMLHTLDIRNTFCDNILCHFFIVVKHNTYHNSQ